MTIQIEYKARLTWTDTDGTFHNRQQCRIYHRMDSETLQTTAFTFEAVPGEPTEDRFLDDQGTVWTPPTAEAYALTCKALDKCKAELAQAKRLIDTLMRPI